MVLATTVVVVGTLGDTGALKAKFRPFRFKPGKTNWREWPHIRIPLHIANECIYIHVIGRPKLSLFLRGVPSEIVRELPDPNLGVAREAIGSRLNYEKDHMKRYYLLGI